jgi:1,4-alpha-glucan branching enzyme
MGNEFGHPEWIDFPREGNGWSYHYCRRQWSLVDNENLRYCELDRFDKAMIDLLKTAKLLKAKPENVYIHHDNKIISYTKGNYVFVYNFNPTQSFDGDFVHVGKEGTYKVVLTSDDGAFGGHSRVDTEYKYKAIQYEEDCGFKMYVPSRTATVLKKIR